MKENKTWESAIEYLINKNEFIMYFEPIEEMTKISLKEYFNFDEIEEQIICEKYL